ncbi:hypothetical protein QYE76_070647 [Lolium multiflorum]|uniref:Ribonuclease H1 N-terminal domain-containing protein n=1 Tax=Lolium multiflorum TaxID=4521 RepID=A0AAD8SKK0_LOLMU|nr:hypothetical protein QYE76_070647 [Lolium multiflorum]
MMTEAEIYREHNSSFARWFKDHIDANPPPMDSDKDKLVLALSHGPAPNLMTYQAYDINGYTFYTEEKDKNSAYRTQGWAKNVTKEDRYFTTMFLPEANKSKSTNATAQNEPWVLAEHVHQCFFITDPSRPSRVIVRRGKRTIVGMDGVANEEDFEGEGDPMMEESEDEDTTYTTRRTATTVDLERRRAEALDQETSLHAGAAAQGGAGHRKEEQGTPKLPRKEEQGAPELPRKEGIARQPPPRRGALGRHHCRRCAITDGYCEMKMKMKLLPYCNGQVILSLVYVQATMASEEQLEDHYNRHFFRTEEDAEAAGDEDHEMEDDAGVVATSQAATRQATPGVVPTRQAATRPGAAGGGGETSGDDPSGAAGSSGTGTSGSKRPRKARRQNTVGTGRDTVKEVDPASGLPKEPKDVAKGYGNQHVSSERSSISTRRTSELRAKRLCEPSSLRVHQTPQQLQVHGAEADCEGKGFEEVHSAFPHVSQADFDAFVANEELQATKNRKLWGKEMRELNIGNHNLGSRGYEGKEPYWAKEDEAYVNAGIENPWLKYKDPLERRFIRSRYHKKKLTGELVTDPKVVTDIIWFTNDKKVLALEKKLEEERQKLSQCDEGSSSQASTGRVAWDKPLDQHLLGSTAAKTSTLRRHRSASLHDSQRRRWSAPHHNGQLHKRSAPHHNGQRRRWSAPPQQPAAPEAEEYERDDFQWDIPTSSQVVHEDQPASKYGCSKKLFDSQETAEEENPEEVAAAAVKKMLSPNTLATVTAVGDGPDYNPRRGRGQLRRTPKTRRRPKTRTRDMYCTLIVVHPQHSHAVYLDSGRDKKKDYTNIKALLNDALTGFANKAGPLKVERKSRGGLVLTHTTNFPCLRQSNEDNGMDAWYAILQMQEYIKYADDMLLPESLRERSGEFFYGYGLPPNDEIELRLEMSRDERPFNTLEGCRPFPLGMPTTYVVYKGRVPGVYDDWEDCRRQVHRFSGNSYKGYPTRVEAEGRYARYLAGEMRDMRRNRMKTMAFVMMVIVTMLFMFYSCAPSAACAACAAVETSRHLFFECATASHVWSRLGVHVPADQFSIWELPAPLGVVAAAWHFGVAAIMWSIWKSRDDLVFNGNTASPSFTIRCTCDDIALWRWRIPHPSRADVDDLRSYMVMRCD